MSSWFDTRALAAALLGTLVLSSATPAGAAGFALFEHGARAAGTAYAGAASRADDAATIFFNPAGLTRLDEDQVVVVAHLLFPSFDFDGRSVLEPENPILDAAGLGGLPVGGMRTDDGAADVLVGNLYYSRAIGEGERWRFGLGISAPFGLTTEYEPDWVGRYHALDSDLVTVNLNPSFAVELNDVVSLGFGVDALYADAELTQAVDFGLLGALAGLPDLAPGQADGRSRVEGDDWGLGYNLGLLLEPSPFTRFGLTFRSKIDVDIEGEARFDVPAVAAPLQTGGMFRDTGAQASITLPEILAVSAYHRLSERWAIMADVTWTRWNRLDALVIDFENPAQSDSVTPLRWQNSLRYAVGGTYSPSERLELRLGLALDEEASSDPAFRTPRVPDSDRTWFTAGLGYRFRGWQVELALAHLEADDAAVDVTSATAPDVPTGLHRLQGEFESDVDIVSAQVTWRVGRAPTRTAP